MIHGGGLSAAAALDRGKMNLPMLNQPNALDLATDLFAAVAPRAAAQELTVGELFDCAGQLKGLGQGGLAVQLYKRWIAFNNEDVLLHAVYFNYGTLLNETGDQIGAIEAFRCSLRLKPDFCQSYINLGRVLEDEGHVGRAVAQWMELVNRHASINGDTVAHKLTALQQIGRVLEGVFKDGAAEDALRQSLDINPNQTEVLQHWSSLRQRQCKWPVIAPWERVSRKDLLKGMSSLSLANFADDPMFQLAKAHHYNKHVLGRPPRQSRWTPSETVAKRRPGPLRIGYVSSDLREHAVGFAMTDIVEQHDRRGFEIFAYYCGIKRPDATQERIKTAADHWTEINDLDDEEAADKILDDGIDILVDLNGYTKDARTKLFAKRPAPIAVNWFGYPGTMGSPYHHYMVADPVIVPEGQERFYSEKIVRLACYQPNDRKRVVAAERPTRLGAGLPEKAFVYCCLNGMQKLTAITFQRWMTILEAVPDSVLWLLAGTDGTDERLRRYAAEAGVAPERLIFAPKLPNPQHLARYPLADLFLDNLPYGAHTTAADSMWMGVPVLTLTGRSFPARVCASVVQAAGIGEMICDTPEAFVARAIDYGRHPETIAAIRKKLAAGRDASLLFDTPKLTADLENLYRQMWHEFEAGLLPVPDLGNLDIYHEIGLELELETIELLSEEAYVALYREKLADRHAFSPIKPDIRLWTADAATRSEGR